MPWVHIVLRVIHIGLGVFWVGGVLFMTFFVGPAVRDAGPEGGKVMGAMVKRGVPKYMPIFGLLTILSGLWMYYRDSVGMERAYMTSPTGMTFGIGGVFAIVALAYGGIVLAPALQKIEGLMKSQPTDVAARDAEVARLRTKFANGTKMVTGLLLVTVVAMAVARYV